MLTYGGGGPHKAVGDGGMGLYGRGDFMAIDVRFYNPAGKVGTTRGRYLSRTQQH